MTDFPKIPVLRSIFFALMLSCLPSQQPLQAEAPARPHLLFPAAKADAIRERFDEPRHLPVKQMILERADKLLTYSGEGKFDATQPDPWKLFAQRLTPSLNDFAWAYFLTGNPIYRDTLIEVMKHETRIRAEIDQNQFRFEFTTKSPGLPFTFAADLLWDELSPELRQNFGQYLDQYLVLKDRPSFGWTNNIGLGYFSAVGTIALFRIDENPEAAAIVAECIERLKKEPYPKMLAQHPDGAYPEGALYMDYMAAHLLPFIGLYERVTGDTSHGLLDLPFFSNTHRFVETYTGGDGVWAPVFDSQPQYYGAGWGAYLGERLNDDTLRWMADHGFENIMADFDGAGRETQRALIPHIIYRDWNRTIPVPDFPTLSMLPSVHTGTIRSDNRLEPDLMLIARGYGENELALRSQHKDVGSFSLYANGENFLIDPGYYQPEANAHSLPLVDGVGPEVRRPSPLRGGEQGGRRALVIDATASYRAKSPETPTIRRLWVMTGSRAVVLLDDIAGPARIESLLQTGFETKVDANGQAAIVTGHKGRLWMQPFGPTTTLKVEGPLDFEKSWIFRKKAEAGEFSWHRVAGAYENNPEQPMVWVFAPVGMAENPPRVEVVRQNGAITVHIEGTEPVEFHKAAGKWGIRGLALELRSPNQ